MKFPQILARTLAYLLFLNGLHLTSSQPACSLALCSSTINSTYIEMFSNISSLSTSPPYSQPYQIMTVDATKTVRYDFDLPTVGLLPTENRQSVTKNISPRRADSSASLFMNLNYTASYVNFVAKYHTYLILTMGTTVGQYNITYVILTSSAVAYLASGLLAPAGSPVFDRINSTFYFSQSYLSSQLIGVFDLAQLLGYGVSQGDIAISDQLLQVHIVNQISYGAGAVIISKNIYSSPKVYFVSASASCGDYIMHLYVGTRVLAANEYVNMTIASSCSRLQDTALDFFQNVSKYNSKMTCRLGGYNNTWVTPPGRYMLPARISDPIQLLLNLSFQVTINTTIIPIAELSVCATLIIRSDFIASNNSFPGSRAYPTRQIYICPWWSIIHKGTLIGNFSSGDINFLTYSDTYNKSIASTWPVHVYIATVNITSLTNFDLMPFAVDALNSLSTVDSEYIVAMEIGVRTHLGDALWTPSELAVRGELRPDSLTNTFLATAEEIIEWVASTPNLMTLIKSVKQFVFSIEDYSYFLLSSRPNPNLVMFYQFCWNSTWSRWVPSYVSAIPGYLSLDLHGKISKEYGKVPLSLESRGESIIFLETTQHYWQTHIPLTVLTTALLYLAYRFAVRFNLKKIAKLLVCFATPSIFMWTMCSQNSQYLSFRCFLQFRAFIGTTPLEIFNLCFCVVVLFFVLLLAVAMPFILRSIRISYRILFGHLIPKDTTAQLYMTSWILLRVIFGFCHAFLHDQYNTQVITIFAFTAATFILLIRNRFVFLSKFMFLTFVLRYMGKLTFFLFLLLEALFVDPSNNQALSIVADYQWIALIVIFASTFLEFVLTILPIKHPGDKRAIHSRSIESPPRKVTQKVILDAPRRPIIFELATSKIRQQPIDREKAQQNSDEQPRGQFQPVSLQLEKLQSDNSDNKWGKSKLTLRDIEQKQKKMKRKILSMRVFGQQNKEESNLEFVNTEGQQ